MLEEKEESKIIEKDNELDTATEEENPVAVLPLDEEQKQIVQEIIKAKNQKELQQQLDLFNINLSKMNILRMIKLTSLLDKVDNQAIKRFDEKPDQASNKDILDYMQVVSSQIDRTQKMIDDVKDKPAIRITDKSSTVNVNISGALDKDSKERVMNVFQDLVKQIVTPAETPDTAIDADFSTEEEKTVYNIDTEDDSDSNESLKKEGES